MRGGCGCRQNCKMSASTAPLMIRLLSASVAAAGRAGQIIKEVLGTGQLDIVDKGGNDPQTEADRRAERCIIGSLAAQFPAVTIVGEESLGAGGEGEQVVVSSEAAAEVLREKCPLQFATTEEKDIVVWVDPLDGTSDFTRGLYKNVTVLIGIAVHGRAVGGVIHQPFLSAEGDSRTVWGLAGLGVRGLDVPNLRPVDPDKLRLTVTESHSSEMLEQAVRAVAPAELLRTGGCGHKILMVLEGVVDAYIYPSQGTKKWDSCAGDGVLRAAGGTLTDIYGRELSYVADRESPMNKQGLVVALDKALHETILSRIPASVHKALPKL